MDKNIPKAVDLQKGSWNSVRELLHDCFQVSKNSYWSENQNKRNHWLWLAVKKCEQNMVLYQH